MTIQYFLFLDFEFDILVMNYKVLPPGMVEMDDIARYKGRFRKIAQNLTFNSKFRIQIQDNQVHCLYKDDEAQIYESVEDRAQIQCSIKITPKAMQTLSSRLLRENQDADTELEEFCHSNINNMSMVEIQ